MTNACRLTVAICLMLLPAIALSDKRTETGPLFESDFGPFFPGKGEDTREFITYPTPESRPNFHTQDISVLYVNFSSALCFCDFNNSIYRWTGEVRDTTGLWDVTVGNNTSPITGSGELSGLDFYPIIFTSPVYNRTKCMYFSSYTSRHDLHFVMSTSTGHSMTVSGLPANRKLVDKITVGASIRHPYQVMFQLFSSAQSGNKSGIAVLGAVIIEDGPCSQDQRNLDCSFETGLCDWILNNKKYIWYPVPFGLHPLIPHKIEWGALGAFGGDGRLWSPLVRAASARCFSFLYVKGESAKSFLKVWLLQRIPNTEKEIQILLYEDSSPFKVFKKLVQISLVTSDDFQIAFQGRSKNLVHGIVVLHTAITDHPCKGMGIFIDLQPQELATAATESSKPPVIIIPGASRGGKKTGTVTLPPTPPPPPPPPPPQQPAPPQSTATRSSIFTGFGNPLFPRYRK